MVAMTKQVDEIGEFAENTSATAEECVALSNELYDQVDCMNGMIDKFKVK